MDSTTRIVIPVHPVRRIFVAGPTKRTVAFGLVAAVLALACSRAALASEALVPDTGTLLLAHFDDWDASADHSVGIGRASGNGVVVADGWSGGALFLDDGRHASFAAEQNLDPEQGTIEFRFQPRWEGTDGHRRLVFGVSFGPKNYLQLNKLPDGRFGVGISAQVPGDDQVYRRADTPVTDWNAGDWHHVAVCWGGGSLELWLDGELAARETGAQAPVGRANELLFHGSGYALDDLCISAIRRFGQGDRLAGPEIPYRARLHRPYPFREPPEAYLVSAQAAQAAPAGSEFPSIHVLPKSYLDDTGLAALPAADSAPRLELFAAPGETEPLAFVVLASQPVEGLAVRVSDLRAGDRTVPTWRVDVRRVVRGPMRNLYTSPPEETVIVNRFLPRWEPQDLAPAEIREVWLSVRVPVDQAPGLYEGTVTLGYAGGERRIPLELEVLPIRLVEHPRKQLGVYTRFTDRLLDPNRAARELWDMRSHGVRHLVTDLEIRYRRTSSTVQVDPTEVERGLDLIRDAGFSGGTIVVGTGLVDLARALGHVEVRPPETGEVLDDDPEFHRIAALAARELAALDAAYADLRVIATHEDEVFDKNRLPLYLRLSSAIRQVPEVPLYVTFHTMKRKHEAMRRELDPFVDLRGNQGYSFEWWLARGNTMADYERELAGSGDEAWFYHNARGVHFTAEWARIVNGVYLWAGPFAVHCPWVYQAAHDNPFDDTDGPASRGHDYGMSFPGSQHEEELVPTRIWEAMREGADDLRYLATLEAAVDRATATHPVEAQEAARFLEGIRALISRGPIASGGDAPDPARRTPTPAAEAPRIDALAGRFTGSDWQAKRREIADRVVWLESLEATGKESGAFYPFQ